MLLQSAVVSVQKHRLWKQNWSAIFAELPLMEKHLTTLQRSNEAHMRNMTRFAAGKLPGNSKIVAKSQ